MTPLRLLELFFDDILVDMIVDLTKLYSYRKKTGVSSEITNKQIRLFLSSFSIFVTTNNLINKTNS